jgi:hypothetical protein
MKWFYRFSIIRNEKKTSNFLPYFYTWFLMFSEKCQHEIKNFVGHILLIVKFDLIFFKMIIFFFYILLWMTITLAIDKDSKKPL